MGLALGVDSRSLVKRGGMRNILRENRRPTRVVFLAPNDVRKGRVEPIEWMRMCEAFAERGLDVQLVTPGISFPERIALDAVWEHFAIPRTFDISIIPTPFRGQPPKQLFRLWMGIASLGLAIAGLLRGLASSTPTVAYTRLPVLIAPWAALSVLLPRRLRPMLVLETHSLPPRTTARLLRRMDLVVVNSRRLKDDLSQLFGIPCERIVHAPLARHVPFRKREKGEARTELGLPAEAVIACHAGKMLKTQIELLLQTACRMRKRVAGFRLLLVGGNPAILEWTRMRVRSLDIEDVVILAGFVPPAQVETFLAASDVLLQHMARSSRIFEYTTPGKSYDYMSAERPIVATDIPLFEEVFGGDGDRAIRVLEHDPGAFADGVLRALSLEDGGRGMAERAVAYVAELSWERRVDSVLEALRI